MVLNPYWRGSKAACDRRDDRIPSGAIVIRLTDSVGHCSVGPCCNRASTTQGGTATAGNHAAGNSDGNEFANRNKLSRLIIYPYRWSCLQCLVIKIHYPFLLVNRNLRQLMVTVSLMGNSVRLTLYGGNILKLSVFGNFNSRARSITHQCA